MGLENASRNAWIAALALHWELGADEALAERPTNKAQWPETGPDLRALTAAPKRAAPPARAAAPRQAQAVPQARAAAPDPIHSARAAAEAATTIAELKAALDAFDGSKLKESARSTVFADGNPAAELMVIGEAPGRDEDRAGLPFVGRSGQLLDRMLAAIGRDRKAEDPAKAAYITNVVPYRPLDNRAPDDQEVRLLLPFLERNVALARPRALLCVGNVPSKHLMEAGVGITRFRGTWRDVRIGDRTIPALATFHPAYLLRQPDMKRLVWRDLLSLAERLDAQDE